jgi:hypothetical protein
MRVSSTGDFNISWLSASLFWIIGGFIFPTGEGGETVAQRRKPGIIGKRGTQPLFRWIEGHTAVYPRNGKAAVDCLKIDCSLQVRCVAINPIARRQAGIAFDAAFALGDEKVFLEGFDGSIMPQFPPSVVRLRGLGKDFYQDARVEKSVCPGVFEYRLATNDRKIGVGIGAGRRNLHSHFTEEHLAFVTIELIRQFHDEVPINPVVVARDSRYWDHFAVEELAFPLCESFQPEVFLGRKPGFGRGKHVFLHGGSESPNIPRQPQGNPRANPDLLAIASSPRQKVAAKSD